MKDDLKPATAIIVWGAICLLCWVLALGVANAMPNENAPLGWRVAYEKGFITDAEITGRKISYSELSKFANIILDGLKYKPDPVGDLWNENPLGEGDCEDYPLLMRKILIEHGYDGRYFQMATGYVGLANPLNHALLVVHTADRGKVIFDNSGIYQISRIKIDKIEYMGVWK